MTAIILHTMTTPAIIVLALAIPVLVFFKMKKEKK